MSPYAIIAALVVLIGTGAGSAYVGYQAGADHYRAQMEAQAAASASAAATEMQRQQNVASAAMRDAIAREDKAEDDAAQIKLLVDAYAQTLMAGGCDALSADDAAHLKAISRGK